MLSIRLICFSIWFCHGTFRFEFSSEFSIFVILLFIDMLQLNNMLKLVYEIVENNEYRLITFWIKLRVETWIVSKRQKKQSENIQSYQRVLYTAIKIPDLVVNFSWSWTIMITSSAKMDVTLNSTTDKWTRI